MVRGWLLFLAANMLIFLLLIPAYDIRPDLHRITNNRVTLLNIDGSIWYGRASLGISDGNRVYALPGQVNWHPVVFLDGMIIGFGLSHPNLEDKIYFGVRPEGYGLGAGKANFSAAWFTALGVPFNTIRPEGDVELSWTDAIEGQDFQAQLLWKDAQSILSRVRPLGDYKFTIEGKSGGPMTFEVSTIKGKLQIEGKGKISPGKDVDFEGNAWAADGIDSSLRGLLGQLGIPRGGKHKITIF